MVVVVINPTYNEKENIPIISSKIFNLPHISQDIHVKQLVVDDNSPDGTADVVKEMQLTNKDICLINGEKRGLGDAYVRGMSYAIKSLNPDVIVMMDADLQHDPKIFPKMIEKINEGYDFIIGSRYIKDGSYPKEWGRLRVLNSKIANLLAIKIAGINGINDCTSGYRAIKVKGILDRVDLDSINAIGYSFQLTLLHKILLTGAKPLEYPINFGLRKHGKSKIGLNMTYLRDILEFFKNAVYIRLHII